MKDKDWDIIIALYDCDSITSAATKLYMSQPTLSKAIDRIESELDIRIVNRTNKGISFTEAGNYLAKQALLISKLIAETNEGLDEMKSGRKELSIGSASSFARYNLPHIISDYDGAGKKYRYRVVVATSSEVVKAVERQEVHVGFVNGDRDWDSKILCSTAKGYIVSKNPITLGDLPFMPMICHHKDVYSLHILETWWRNNFGSPLKIAHYVSDISTSLRWISEGLGYGVMYEAESQDYDVFHKLEMRDQHGEHIHRNTWAIYLPRRIKEPAVRDFIEFLNRIYKDRNSRA